jgi:hypothetical protein
VLLLANVATIIGQRSMDTHCHVRQVLETLWAEHSEHSFYAKGAVDHRSSVPAATGTPRRSVLKGRGSLFRSWLSALLSPPGGPVKPSTIKFGECHGLELYLSPLMQRALRNAMLQQNNRQIQPKAKPNSAKRHGQRRFGIRMFSTEMDDPWTAVEDPWTAAAKV